MNENYDENNYEENDSPSNLTKSKRGVGKLPE
jgi:hypothetical protein